jgi:hypothetical protein
MKSAFLAALFSGSVLLTLAQSTSVETQSSVESIAEGNSMFRSFDNRNKKTKGQLTVFEEYLPGGVTMNNGDEIDFNRMNYDGYHDVIIVVRKKQEQVVTTMMVKSFYIADYTDTLRFDRLLRPDNRMGYYQRLTEGTHVKLYKKLFTTIQEPTYTGAYSLGKQHAELVPGFTYYIQEGTFRPKEFKNKKMFLDLFPDEEQQQLSAFIKEKKTDFKDDQEVIALIEYANNLRAAGGTN